MTSRFLNEGRILVEPGVADRDQLVRDERKAKAELDAALGDVSAESLADAQILRDHRRDFEATADAARQELERLAPSGNARTLRPRIDELRQALDNASLGELNGQPPSRDTAEAKLKAVQAAHQKARDEERIARKAADERQRAVSDVSVEVRTLQNAVESQNELIQKRDERLRIDAETVSDPQLAEASESAERALRMQQENVATLEKEWPASARARMEARILRLESAIRQREQSRVDLRIERAGLRERIEVHDSAGIDEAIEHTQHELEQASRLRDRFIRDTEILTLLADTLRTAESEARERYLAPVVNRVHPYLQMLFPDAEIGMDEDLNITGMSRIAGYEENFDRLSMGTQEQIAVLVRLAFAEMLIDQGRPRRSDPSTMRLYSPTTSGWD